MSEQTFVEPLPFHPDRREIVGNILKGATSEEQVGRLLTALDKYTSFYVALDSNNYKLALARVAMALDAGEILQEDYDLVATFVPDIEEVPE